MEALHNTHSLCKNTHWSERAARNVPQLAQIEQIPQIFLVIVFWWGAVFSEAAINQSGGEEEAPGCVPAIFYSIYSDKGVFL